MKKRLHQHHFSRPPCPVSKCFFGQNFVISSLSAVSSNLRGQRNTFWIRHTRDEKIFPLCEKIGKEKLGANVERGYDVEAVIRNVRENLVQNVTPVLTFHYPLADRAFISMIDEELILEGMRDKVVMVGYQHTLADYGAKAAEEAGSTIAANRSRRKTAKYLSRVYEILDVGIAVSKSVRDSIGEILGSTGIAVERIVGLLEKIAVVGNGVDQVIYSPASEEEKQEMRESLGISPKVKRLVAFVGRIDDMKGGDVLAELTKAVEESKNSEDEEIGFVIATGDVLNNHGTIRPSSLENLKEFLSRKRLIEEGRLKIVVDVAKYVRGDERFGDELDELLESELMNEVSGNGVFGGFTTFSVQKSADVTVLPSRSEAHPLVVLESLSAGTPVVVSRCGESTTELVESSGGYVVDAESRADAVIGYLEQIRSLNGTRIDLKNVPDDVSMYTKVEEVILSRIGGGN